MDRLPQTFTTSQHGKNTTAYQFYNNVILRNIFCSHIRLGRFGKAQPIIEEAIRLKMAFYGNNDVEVADSLHKLGIVFVSKNNFGSALQTFHRALRIYRSASELSQISEIIFKIGCIHFQINEFMAALMAFEEAMDIEQSLHIDGKPTDGRAEILCHLAFVKIKLKQYGDAIIFLEEALSVSSLMRCQKLKSLLI